MAAVDQLRLEPYCTLASLAAAGHKRRVPKPRSLLGPLVALPPSFSATRGSPGPWQLSCRAAFRPAANRLRQSRSPRMLSLRCPLGWATAGSLVSPAWLLRMPVRILVSPVFRAGPCPSAGQESVSFRGSGLVVALRRFGVSCLPGRDPTLRLATGHNRIHVTALSS